MISVEEARTRICAAFAPVATEMVALTAAAGRVLARDLAARRTQPPHAVSAMDGYAVRAQDVGEVPVRLEVVGEAPAGGAFTGTVGPGQAVRIFTGGPVPAGADTIIVQEDTDLGTPAVTVNQGAPANQHVRRAGIDFSEGEVLLQAGRRLGARDIGLAAAMNHPWIAVTRKPRVALLATGDEVVRPGDPLGPNQIVSSNGPALAAFIESRGGIAIDLGIAADDEASIRALAQGARGADLLVTMGGVSVGDRDLVRKVLGEAGLEVDFWRIAMKPGKPLMFGSLAGVPVLGLPGNPVSSMVCALLFLGPALDKMAGLAGTGLPVIRARLGADIGANNFREDYMRATLTADGEGTPVVVALAIQDSSMASALARADGLIIRPPGAPAASAGDWVDVIRLDDIPGA
ncbi:MAG: molybdopterin molybdotransferase MoeA [Alphaproteobacteria bacterium]|nr:molybdopterin molybdotransferase MoeA [Pseudomonadota bacterium]TDI67061.1 MAG: molybdopterin molybdotransferase MoeA [Alphaproteobacteria bacterium]